VAAYSIATFKARFDFFSTAADPVIQACLDAAEAAYGHAVDFPQYRGIVGNHAAHLLASNPGGTSMRLSKTSAETLYSVERDKLLEMLPATFLAIA
jgi:hypothetical protein